MAGMEISDVRPGGAAHRAGLNVYKGWRVCRVGGKGVSEL
eukprot:gene12406-24010_t